MFHHSHSHLFPDGSSVEISSDEEGFKGAWYLGKILNSAPEIPSPSSVKSKRKRASKVSNLVEVQYENLLSDDNENEPLREFVDVSLLRPVPPSQTVESFALNDVVDGFYRDGWWTGVVTKVLEGSRYRVYFQNPPDLIEFFISDLRPHFDWLDGEWVRPTRQGAQEFYLFPGNDVEVKLDNENPCDVWYLGSIVQEIGNNYYLAAYRSSVTDAAAKKVAVASSHIRPYPPCWEDRNFYLLEKVDAFYDFGWWSGVITRILTDRRYIVFFKHSKMEKELSHSELRPHADWMNGKWVVQSRPHPEEESNHEFNCVENTHETPQNESLGVTMDNPIVVEEPSSTSSKIIIVEQPIPGEETSSEMPTVSGKKKLLNSTPDSNSSLLQPLKKQKEGNAKAASVTSCRLRKRSLENTVEEATSDFTTQSKQKADESVSTDQPSAKTKNTSLERVMEGKEQKVGGVDTQVKETPRKRGRPRKSLETPAVTLSNHSGQAAKELGGKFGISEGAVVIGLASNTKKRPQTGNSSQNTHEESPGHKNKKQQTGHPKKQDSHKFELHQDGVRCPLRRRGRKPKLPVMFLQGLEKAGVPAGEVVEKGSAGNPSESTPSMGLESPGTRSGSSFPTEESSKLIKDQKLTNGPAQDKSLVMSRARTPRTKKERIGKETLGQVFGKHLQKTSLKRGKSDGPSKNVKPQTQENQDASKEKIPEVERDLTVKEVQVDADRKSISASDDDRPLSMWIAGSDAQLALTPALSLGGHEEISRHLALVDVGREGVIDDFQGLPFLKGSPVWTTIESMPIFGKMPQRPHFRPLQNFKEEHREGLAIGNMVTFATLVEKTAKLQFDNPKSVFDSSLEALLDLETHGFDVKVVRGRINEMLAFKDKQGQLLDKSKDFQSQITELNHEKKRIDYEIDEIDQKLRELQEQRVLAVSKRESKDLEIAHLQAGVDVIVEGIQKARVEFQKLAAAPW